MNLTEAQMADCRMANIDFSVRGAAGRDDFARHMYAAGLAANQREVEKYADSKGRCDGIETVVKMLEKKADDYAMEYGYEDMGALSFGSGQHAEAKLDYHSNLIELAEEVRALNSPSPSATVHVCPEKDIVCGTNPSNWCDSCPLIPKIDVERMIPAGGAETDWKDSPEWFARQHFQAQATQEPVATKSYKGAFADMLVSLEDNLRLKALPFGAKLYLGPTPLADRAASQRSESFDAAAGEWVKLRGEINGKVDPLLMANWFYVAGAESAFKEIGTAAAAPPAAPTGESALLAELVGILSTAMENHLDYTNAKDWLVELPMTTTEYSRFGEILAAQRAKEGE